uniref:Putative GIY-YIG homing endonuclease n=1 Tax=Dunaliella salina TaxID=3046 RepID=A0A1C8XRM1_DUNSA|nr:putative GIY-YIG homing endonuclease [Dunaliella salina]
MKTLLTKPYVIFKEKRVDVKEPNFISNLQNKLIDLILELLDLFQNKPEIFTQRNNRLTGNTNKLGFYMIYNKKTKKFYLGNYIEFSKRIAYYNRDFRNYFSNKKSKLYKSFIEDIQTNHCSEADFYFVPIMSFDKTTTEFINLESLESSVSNSNSPIVNLLETIEFNAIEYFLVDFGYSTKLYNKVASSKFTIGNKLRSPKSGQASQPIQLKNTQFAWESVSLAAQFINVDRHTIRNKLGIKFEYLSPLEFENWNPNYKISKTNVNSFDKKSIIDLYKKST